MIRKDWLAGLCVGIAAAPALAQDESKPTEQAAPAVDAAATPAAGTTDPEADKVIAASKEALKNVRDISYHVVQEHEEGIVGDVWVSIPEQPMGFPIQYYRIAQADSGGAPSLEWAWNGKTFAKIDHSAKKMFSMDVSGGAIMPPQELWGVFPQWLLEVQFENPNFRTTSTSITGDGEVGGVKCRVVKQVQEMSLGGESGETGSVVFESTRHIGGEDSIPRKVELSIRPVGLQGAEAQSMTETMTNLKVNAGLTTASFSLTAPEGYATEPGTYENLGLQDPSDSGPELKAEVGKPALAFSLKDAAGKEVTQEGLKGRVVLLDFWATWCGPCKRAMPAIQRIHEKYADKSVSIIGINCWEEDPSKAVAYMESQKFTYTLLLQGDELAESYGVSGIPTLILIGKDGNVLHAGSGFGPGEEEHLSKLIDDDLAKQ